MFNSKTDIRDSKWIDLVFEKRNKEYGAYDLRKHAADNMNRALAIMLFILSASVAIAIFINPKPAAVAMHKSLDYTSRIIHLMPLVAVQKPVQPQNSLQQGDKPVNRASATLSRSQVTGSTSAVTPASPAAMPVQNTAPAANPNQPETDNAPAANNNVVIDNDELDVKPRFLGGAQEWSRFLEMNLRYPAEARQAKISGIVWVSFIVERNGSISNINIDKPAGHGFDEEAIRVLKQSPVWTPGEENGQTVRVKYSLPINFHMVR